MTVDEFDMDPSYSGYFRETVWKISMRDCDTKTEFKVDDDVIQECISDNFDYIIDTVGKELTERVFNMNDLGQITDEEKAIFDKIMLMVVGE